MMLNTIRSRVTLVVGVATILGLLAAYTPAKPVNLIGGAPPDVPAAIKVPAGNKLFLVAQAVGTQNYTCNGAGAWGPSVPAAMLFDKHMHPIGTHFGGPTWQYQDGSSVLGQKIAGVPVTPGAIDWLLLKAVSTTPGANGGDRLVGTTYIQRLTTNGGLAPAGACVTASTASVPYTAVYYFYRAVDPVEDE
jgi:hypothetical protein